MFCEKCFALLPDNARFCRECGKKTAFPKPEATVTKERALFTPEEKIRSADEAETEETSEAVKTVPEVLHEKRSVFSAVLIIFAFLASLGALALMVLPFTDIKYGFPHYVRTLDLQFKEGILNLLRGLRCRW